MRILIIRPGAIGDTLVTFPLLHYLRSQTSSTHLTFVGNAAVLPLLQTFALADDIANYEERRWSQLFLSPASSRQQSLQPFLRTMDRAICWMGNADGAVTANLQAAGIPRYSVVPGRPPASCSLPIGNYLAQSIGEDAAIGHHWQVPDTYAWQTATDLMGPIAIHPGSGGQAKCWPTAHFAQIITALWQQNIPVLLLAGPAEQSRLRDLRQLLPEPPEPALLQQLSNAPLLTVTRALQHCRAYLGNDSGITHLAAQIGIPTLAIFGPSNPLVWKPLGPTVTTLHTPQLSQLSPDIVLAALTDLL